jgi:hypothetical protein
VRFLRLLQSHREIPLSRGLTGSHGPSAGPVGRCPNPTTADSLRLAFFARRGRHKASRGARNCPSFRVRPSTKGPTMWVLSAPEALIWLALVVVLVARLA